MPCARASCDRHHPGFGREACAEARSASSAFVARGMKAPPVVVLVAGGKARIVPIMTDCFLSPSLDVGGSLNSLRYASTESPRDSLLRIRGRSSMACLTVTALLLVPATGVEACPALSHSEQNHAMPALRDPWRSEWIR